MKLRDEQSPDRAAPWVERETTVEASPEEVWEALTDEDRLEEWLAPEVELDPSEGGTIAVRDGVVEPLARGGTVTATGLAAQLPITRQAVAKHLSALSGADLVSSTRVGRETHYELRPQPLSEAAHWIQTVSAEWDDRLEALRLS